MSKMDDRVQAVIGHTKQPELPGFLFFRANANELLILPGFEIAVTPPDRPRYM